jgi:hypothetical protein
MSDTVQAAQARLSAVATSLGDAFDPESFGLPWYASIEDRAVRVVRSNQAIGLVEAARAHIDALIEAARQVRELVGPNGRVMPTPDEVDGLRTLSRIHVETTDALRAAGSLLDVLGGLTVLCLGLPINPTWADSRQLLKLEPRPASPSEAQTEAVETVRNAVAAALGSGPPGWLEWTIESRNAEVHRGRSLSVWMPVPTKRPRRILVHTRMEPRRVTRQFPHLRRQPDLSDAETVLTGSQHADLWLHEPAQDTLDGLTRECGRLAGALAQVLPDLDPGAFNWPEEEWALQPRSQRARAAAEFAGFDPERPAPVADAMVLNPREAKRLLTVEKLRLEQDG